jgi:hypothetical protein
MSVKGNIIKFAQAPTLDQRWKDSSGAAERIQSCRIDPQGAGYLFDRGLEPWRDFSGANILTTDTSPYLDKPVDSQFIWTKQSTGQVYHFIEQGGELYYLWGNNGSPVPAAAYWADRITIDKDRRIRKVGDAGTQYIPYGNRLLIVNGYDKPIWFYGDNKWRDFGFSIATPSLEYIPIQQKYDSVNELKEGIGFPRFSTASVVGLGNEGNSDTSFYTYMMTFITDTGSESPFGGMTSSTWTNETGFTSKHGILLNDIAVGKKGVVARRIYRTKNQRTTGAGGEPQLFYLVRQIDDNSTTDFIDIVPDTSLINEAPLLTASAEISTTFQFGTAWNNRLWLGGGPDHPTRIIYSEAGLPEQFGAFNYFDIGSTNGGHITALFSYYNNLLVFRERSIEIIRDNGGIFTVSQLTPDIGTTATNTICLVPGVGVTFINKDGIYTVGGGLDGGSTVSVKKISDTIGKEIQNVNVQALPNCCAAYSKKEKEYWIQYVRKGLTYPTRGIIIHTYNGAFSFRGANLKADEYLWAFTTIQSDPDGNFILGTKPDWRTALGVASNPNTTGSIGRLIGLQVWSGAAFWGTSLVTGALQQETFRQYVGAEAPLQKNLYESNWIDFGDSSVKHRVFSVEMEMVSYGDNTVLLEWGQDYDVTFNSAGTCKISKPELLFTKGEDPVFGPADVTVTKSTFEIGKSSLKAGRKVVIRWDVATQLVDNFRFRVSQSEGKPFHILGFTINYATRDQAPLNQRTSTAGQPY